MQGFSQSIELSSSKSRVQLLFSFCLWLSNCLASILDVAVEYDGGGVYLGGGSSKNALLVEPWLNEEVEFNDCRELADGNCSAGQHNNFNF